jgi:hypothetical protein
MPVIHYQFERLRFARDLAFCLCIASLDVRGAVLSGSVSLAAGHGIRASLTIHDLSTPRTAGHKPYDHQFASKADGSFSLTGVPAGKYRICVDAPHENVLDPCLWSDTQQIWTVADSDNLTKLAIKVQIGTQVKVHVTDPQGALPQTKGGVHGEALSMVVMTNRKRYHNLRLLSAGKNWSDHYVVVPFDEPPVLVTESASLAVSDKDGKRVSGDSQKMPVRVAAGAIMAPVVVNVAKR